MKTLGAIFKVLGILLLLGVGMLALVATACGMLFHGSGGGGVAGIGLIVMVLCVAGIVGLARSGGDDGTYRGPQNYGDPRDRGDA
ncbi:MAG TPA: hypothetical protein VGN52_04140 [Burkholderiales bacterium]|jgi:hypothetical protein